MVRRRRTGVRARRWAPLDGEIEGVVNGNADNAARIHMQACLTVVEVVVGWWPQVVVMVSWIGMMQDSPPKQVFNEQAASEPFYYYTRLLSHMHLCFSWHCVHRCVVFVGPWSRRRLDSALSFTAVALFYHAKVVSVLSSRLLYHPQPPHPTPKNSCLSFHSVGTMFIFSNQSIFLSVLLMSVFGATSHRELLV